MNESIFTQIKEDHRDLERHFSEACECARENTEIAKQYFMKLRDLLFAHTHAVENVLHARLLEKIDLNVFTEEKILEEKEEHELMSSIAGELGEMSSRNPRWKSKLLLLRKIFERHVADEEEQIQRWEFLVPKDEQRALTASFSTQKLEHLEEAWTEPHYATVIDIRKVRPLHGHPPHQPV